MGYSSIEEIRLESGIDDEEILSNNDIQEDIDAADSIINNSTQHIWVEGVDASFALVKKISKLLASSFSMDRLSDPKEEGEKNFNKGMMLLQLLTAEDEVASDVVIAVTEYQTFPKNPNALVSRGRLSPNGITERNINPDDAIEDF